MHALGIVFEHRRFVADDLLQTGAADLAKGLARRHVRRERNSGELHRRASRAFQKAVAAFRLAR